MRDQRWQRDAGFSLKFSHFDLQYFPFRAWQACSICPWYPPGSTTPTSRPTMQRLLTPQPSPLATPGGGEPIFLNIFFNFFILVGENLWELHSSSIVLSSTSPGGCAHQPVEPGQAKGSVRFPQGGRTNWGSGYTDSQQVERHGSQHLLLRMPDPHLEPKHQEPIPNTQDTSWCCGHILR